MSSGLLTPTLIRNSLNVADNNHIDQFTPRPLIESARFPPEYKLTPAVGGVRLNVDAARPQQRFEFVRGVVAPMGVAVGAHVEKLPKARLPHGPEPGVVRSPPDPPERPFDLLEYSHRSS